MKSSWDILRQSMIELGDNTKLIRLATITTFIHSLLFIVYMLYLLFNLSQKNSWSWIRDLLSEYVDIVAPSTEVLVILIIIWIVLLIGYTLLPPIWDASMIYYLESKKKSGSLSLGKWVTKFFPMFEFNATMTMFNFWLAIYNMWITLKFIVINIFLYLRFIVNILIVVWIPLLLLRWASKLEIANSPIFNTVVIIIIVSLMALTAYINGIIEAFFITYWWKVYKRISDDDQEELA